MLSFEHVEFEMLASFAGERTDPLTVRGMKPLCSVERLIDCAHCSIKAGERAQLT